MICLSIGAYYSPWKVIGSRAVSRLESLKSLSRSRVEISSDREEWDAADATSWTRYNSLDKLTKFCHYGFPLRNSYSKKLFHGIAIFFTIKFSKRNFPNGELFGIILVLAKCVVKICMLCKNRCFNMQICQVRLSLNHLI